MDFQNKYSVKLRVSLLLSLFVLLLASLGIFTLQRISILNDLTETLYNHPLQVSNAALRAKTGVIRMHRSMKDVALSKTQLELDLAIETVLHDEMLVHEDLAIVRNLILGAEGQDLVARTISMFVGWKPIRGEVEELVQEGRRDEAADITRLKGADYVAELERQLNDLTRYAHNKADGFIANARDIHEDIREKMIWIICIVSILCLVSAFIVIGGITKSIHALQEKMAESVKSGELQQIDMDGNDEFSLLAQHFNSLVRTIQDQLWLSANLNDLNNRLIGDKPLEELSQRTISFVARAVEGCAGALYLYDTSTQRCILNSSFASIERNPSPESFSLSEGTIGQVAFEKAPLLLKNISRDDARATGGTFSEPPVCIYAVPIIFDNTLLAVVEIAFFEEITSIRKQFIDEAAGSIGGILNNALQDKRIKSLLSKSQEANVELESKSLEIKDKNEELNALNKELKAQTTELQAQKNEIEAKRNQVEEADRLKSEFLSNMSHELRTPLNSILSLAQLLLSRGVENDPQSSNEYMQVIDRNGRQLLNLINDILDLTKIESGRMELFVTDFSVQSLVSELGDTMKPLAEEKSLQLFFPRHEELSMRSDKDKVHQILLNFLSNAIKFTDRGGVELSVTTMDDEIVFSVVDQGIGISVKDQESIFDEFRQVDGSFTRAHDGTGLGLAISKKLAKLLGGTIAVSSALDQGSTFTLSIPCNIEGGESLPSPHAVAVNQSGAGGDRAFTILVIDDDDDDRIDIVNHLVKSGYQTVEAASGEEGVRIARETQPDLISLDLIMPGMDGWEVLNTLKNDAGTTAIPIIITSIMQEEETSRALGAAGCLKKPVDRGKLLALISEISQHNRVGSVLIIDDDLGVREYLTDMLSGTGYSVYQAQNGVAALGKYDELKPDLIILDLVMPVLDGFGFLKQLRERYDPLQTPVIVLTSKDLTRDDQHQLEGTSGTFTKHNLDKQLFLDSVTQVLEKAATENGQGTQGTFPTILVVDDNDVAGEQIKIVLEESGFNVKLARDGEQGLKAIQENIPDGIVLDLMMPEIDGFSVLEQIRSHEETAGLPVLVLTAKEITAEERQRLTSNNVHQLIQKGTTDRKHLVSGVRRLLQTGKASIPSAGRVQPRRETILIIEDNRDNRFTVQAILKEEGYHIRFAENGKEGVECALRYKPSIILMDIHLPDLSGIDAMKLIKSSEEVDNIPIIALTAKAMRGDREEFLAEGFDDYTPKPINPDELIEKVKFWLNGKHASSGNRGLS